MLIPSPVGLEHIFLAFTIFYGYALINHLPMVAETGLFPDNVQVEVYRSSDWARSYKISVQTTDEDTDTYFMKVSPFPVAIFR